MMLVLLVGFFDLMLNISEFNHRKYVHTRSALANAVHDGGHALL